MATETKNSTSIAEADLIDEAERERIRLKNELVNIINEHYPRLVDVVEINTIMNNIVRGVLLFLFAMQVSAFGFSINNCAIIMSLGLPVVFLPTVKFNDEDDPGAAFLYILIQGIAWMAGGSLARGLELEFNGFGLLSSAAALLTHVAVTRPLRLNNIRINKLLTSTKKFLVEPKSASNEYSWGYVLVINVPEKITTIDECVTYIQDTRDKAKARLGYAFVYNIPAPLVAQFNDIMGKIKGTIQEKIFTMTKNGDQLFIKWRA